MRGRRGPPIAAVIRRNLEGAFETAPLALQVFPNFTSHDQPIASRHSGLVRHSDDFDSGVDRDRGVVTQSALLLWRHLTPLVLFIPGTFITYPQGYRFPPRKPARWRRSASRRHRGRYRHVCAEFLRRAVRAALPSDGRRHGPADGGNNSGDGEVGLSRRFRALAFKIGQACGKQPAVIARSDHCVGGLAANCEPLRHMRPFGSCHNSSVVCRCPRARAIVLNVELENRSAISV